MSNSSGQNYANVILIYPKTGMDMGSTVAPPHSLLAIAAPVSKKGYNVKIIDMRTSSNWESLIKETLNPDTICIGLSVMTGTQIYFALKAAKIVKELNSSIPIIFGGPHPTILPEQTLNHELVDIVVIGEADFGFLELVQALENKKDLSKIFGIAYKNGNKTIITAKRELVDINELLPTPWHLVNVEDYIHPDFYIKKGTRALDIGQTSRGCPFNCSFCSSASIRERKWRAMTTEKALHTIIHPIKKFNLTGIWIRDDEFYINRIRVNQICEGLLREVPNIKWYTSGTRVDVFNKSTDEELALIKRSGADVLKFGAESGNNRILKLINKGITVEDTIKANLRTKKFGIIPAFALIIGFPTETFEEINNTIDFGYKLQEMNPQAQLETMAVYTALPGTPMYQLAIDHGLLAPNNLEGWINWILDDYDFEGRKIPWYSYKKRKMIGNITYMSILGNAIHNLIGSIENYKYRYLFKFISFFTQPYFKFRLKHKYYRFVPELALVRLIKKRLLYTSNKTIR